MTQRAKPDAAARPRLPRFRDEAEEREFWATHDSADYVDWARARRVSFPNLKPSTESISLRRQISSVIASPPAARAGRARPEG